MALTEFQINALKEVERLFDGVPKLERRRFQEVVGKKETYLKAIVNAPHHVLEVYLYEDEAGYLEVGEWTIFEKPDYYSSSELLGAFLASLRDKVR